MRTIWREIYKCDVWIRLSLNTIIALDMILKAVFTFIKLLCIVLRKVVTIFLPQWLLGTKGDLQAELVLVTGAGKGLGRSLAITFAKMGSSLVLWDIDEESVRAVADEVATYGAHAYPYLCDCADREAVFRMAEKVKKEVGNISVIVNNAGIVTGKSVMEIDPSKFEKVLKVNTFAHFWVGMFTAVEKCILKINYLLIGHCHVQISK